MIFSINLIFVDEKTIWQLNKKYRGIDKPTTVLSFYYGPEELTEEKRAGKKEGEETAVLGEVFICPSLAKKQGFKIGELISHGINNLLPEIQTEKNFRIRLERSQGKSSKNC